ncbi:MAG: DnaA/Hda family protein [Pseudomonadota bacterium]
MSGDSARQIPFEFLGPPAMDSASFVETAANATARAVIEHPEGWPEGRVMLLGPPGSGKTHLARIWATGAGAFEVAAPALRSDAVPTLVGHGALVVEGIDTIAGRPGPAPEAARALFHLLNLARAEGARVLMTSRAAPAQLDWATPDLASRLAGTATAALLPPDDTLLGAVLAKLFADRGVEADARLITYLVQRMERSLAAAVETAERLDRAALAAQRRLTPSFAGRVLGWTG